MVGIDFFCGGGGMTKGLIESGIDVLFGFDSNPNCKETYERNNNIPYLCLDITKLDIEELIARFPEIDHNEELIAIGCAPCQPFSKQRHSEQEHIATNLLDYFGEVVAAIMPGFVVIENVPGIEGKPVFLRFVALLREHEYNITYKVLNAKDFGVPQNRRRLVMIASRICIPELPEKTHGNERQPYQTVRDTIYEYPAIRAGEKDDAIPNHVAAKLSSINIRRIQATPHDGGGRMDWPKELILNCHSGKHKGHTDVYGRMRWNQVAPTLTSKCFSLSNGRFGHPVQDRAISLREAAALQSFPDDYVFYGSQVEIGKQIGNAVPVILAERIGEKLQELYYQYLNQNNM